MPKRIAIVAFAAALAAVLVATGAFAGGGSGAATAQKTKFKKAVALFAVMNGRKEVDANGNKRVGDPEGVGSFTAIVAGGDLCYGYTVAGIDTPAAAHIHKGRPNQAGPVVLPLDASACGDPGDGERLHGRSRAELAAAILKNPGKYYVNVHTGPFPGGAVRGQLRKRQS